MAKEKDDKIVDIPERDRLPELELEVQRYLSLSAELPHNNKLFKRVSIPKRFSSDIAKNAFHRSEIIKCLKGNGDMNGKMYFWFNYVFIEALGSGSAGKIRPDYRVADHAWFDAVEKAKEANRGVVCVKRRRAGFSWKAAADALHDILFNPGFHVGMNSKTERDSILLYQKVLFIFDNLPSFLKARIGSRRNLSLAFFIKTKDEYGNVITKGLNSRITVVPPTDSAYEGMMLGKWICDEAGKIPNLPQIWAYTEDCLMRETVRIGTPIVFGTSGDIGKDGAGLLDMWENSEVYRMDRFFFAGWMGLDTDEYGNDNKEKCIRWIVYERHRRKGISKKFQSDFIQKYPLTPTEAFNRFVQAGVGDVDAIKTQQASLRANPSKQRRGNFVMGKDNDIKFIVNPQGSVIIYEDPDPLAVYVSGCDPADHDDSVHGSSDMSLHIIKKQQGLIGPKIVLEYVDRPQKADDYYTQAAMALTYFNKTKSLIERNRYRMISFFEETGQKHLLATTPTGISRLFQVQSSTLGIHMNTDVKGYLLELVEWYTQEYCELIPSEELLKEFIEFGSRNTDRVMSFGLALMMLKEDKRSHKDAEKKNTPKFSYKMVGGRMMRVRTN
jgi:hypothetical protein